MNCLQFHLQFLIAKLPPIWFIPFMASAKIQRLKTLKQITIKFICLSKNRIVFQLKFQAKLTVQRKRRQISYTQYKPEVCPNEQQGQLPRNLKWRKDKDKQLRHTLTKQRNIQHEVLSKFLIRFSELTYSIPRKKWVAVFMKMLTNIHIYVVIDFSIIFRIPLIHSISKEQLRLIWEFFRCLHVVILSKNVKIIR